MLSSNSLWDFTTKRSLINTEGPANRSVPIYPLRDFFQNPKRSFFRLSDHGKNMAYMEPIAIGDNPARLNILVQSLNASTPEGAATVITHETERDISQFFWKGDDIIIFEKDFKGDENFHVIAVNVHTGKHIDLTPYEGVRAGIQDDLEDDPDHILVAHNQENAELFNIYKVNVHTGQSELVAKNPGNVVGWQTDHNGNVRLAMTSDGLNTDLLYRASDMDEFSSIIHTDFRTSVSPLFFTSDNQRFYALSNRGRDTLSLVIIDPLNPHVEELIYEVADYDLSGAGYSTLRKVLTAAYYESDKLHYHFFDEVSAKRYERLRELLVGYEVSIQSATRDEQKFIVAAYNDRTLGSRYIYDEQSDTLTKLVDINPALPEADMAEMKAIRFTARDGLKIQGYLSLPVNKAASHLPLIVNPHGGPWARDSWGFNPEVQFLVNRGYAVLQINFRGSTGFGRKFWEASFGQWGLSMQDDITDGVQWAIDEGIADPKRIAIYGGSYGGYATLSGICKTPELYAAAVDYVGVSNLLTFMNTIPPYWKPLLEKMYAMVGHPEHDKQRLVETSPALQAHKIRTPLFVAQGAHDPRVNIAESDQMVQALRDRGVEVDYMVKENEGHGFHNDENKFEFYEKMESFLSLHLHPQQ